MSNPMKTFPSEMEIFVDKKSGRKVIQLTKTGANYHFYFTENSFTEGDEEILYLHSDLPFGTVRNFDLFALDLKTGVRTQLSDFTGKFKQWEFRTKSRDSKIIVLVADGVVYRMDRDTLALTPLYTVPKGFFSTGCSISYDNRYLAICMSEKVVYDREFTGCNYDGFADRFHSIKRGRIVLITLDGSEQELLVQDTHHLQHVQFAPDSNEFLSFCHEGPWHLVRQRMWLFNLITRRVSPCFRQVPDDSVGHEFWTRDGLLFFDNRGPGHDGTITVDKKQAVVADESVASAIPKVGFADRYGNILRYFELPYYANHYHANNDNTLLVGDAVEDIVLMDIHTDTPSYTILCEHNTSWVAQHTHPHPTFSWSCDKILFASDRDKQGESQLYYVPMNETV